MCLTYQAYVNLEYVGGGSRGQAGPDILMAAFYPDYCFLISLIGKPWIGGTGKWRIKDTFKTKAGLFKSIVCNVRG